MEQLNRSTLLSEAKNTSLDATTGDSSQSSRPIELESKLAEIRASRPSAASAFNSGYADILPWLEEAKPNIGRIAEFELTRLIGRGGMGIVFEAHDTKLERAVAIKLMSPGMLADPSASERFLREARSAAKINHANIVTVHAVGETNGLPYLVMELVQGHSLEEQLAGNAVLPTNEILKIARHTALGLTAAHKNGITHRDIKPSNLMFDKQAKRIRIADFGLASTVNENSLTRSGTLVGTPDFSSPEQIDGRPVDSRSDLFSLGSVLYMICSGKPPFASESLVQTLNGVRHAEPDFATLSERAVPQGLIEIIRRLMQKNPEDRFRTTEELCEALKQVPVSDRSIDSMPNIAVQSTASAGSDTRDGSGINKVCLAVAGVLLAIATVLLTVWWNQSQNPPQLSEQQDVKNSNQGPSDSDLQIPPPAEEVKLPVKEAELPVKETEPANETESPTKEAESPVKEEAESKLAAVTVNSTRELYDALEQPGDLVIQLVDGQTYELDQPIQIESRSVRFEGDAEEFPVLQIRTGVEEAAIFLEGGELMFRGVRILDKDAGEREEGLILCESGMLEFVDCVLVSDGREHVLEVRESDLVFRSTVLVAENTCVYMQSEADQQVQVFDSVLLSAINFRVEHIPRFELIAEDSSFVAWSGLEIGTEDPGGISIDFQTEDCDFNFSDAMFHIVNESDDEADRFETYEVEEAFAERFRLSGTGGSVPINLVHFDDEFIGWEDADTELNEGMIQNASNDEASLESLIERCLRIEITSVDQIRGLLVK